MIFNDNCNFHKHAETLYHETITDESSIYIYHLKMSAMSSDFTMKINLLHP